MRTIQKLSNVSIGATSLGKVEITKVGQAIAHIPEFMAYFDAEYYIAGDTDLLNMANGKALQLSAAAKKVKDAKGFDCIQREYIASAPPLAHVGDYDINSKAWTFFVVVHPDAEVDSNALRYFRLAKTLGSENIRALHLVISNTSQTIQQLRTSQSNTDFVASAIIDGGLAAKQHPSIVMYTYSGGHVRIRVNGKEVANASASEIELGLKAGEWDWFRNANGKYYAWGGLNIDLTAAENKQYLNDLEQFYIKKYKIIA